MSLLISICAGAGGAATAATAVGLFLRGVVRRQANEVVAPAIAELKTTIEARFDKNDAATKTAADKAASLELELARQFGGNSGGMRQAINETRQDIAVLKGAFDQHIKEANK